MSQVGAAVNSIRFRMPSGVNPPWILRFSASTVPIIQLSLSSDTLSESEIYDYGLFRVRQQLTTVPGTLLAVRRMAVLPARSWWTWTRMPCLQRGSLRST